jgi:hypothetical protein
MIKKIILLCAYLCCFISAVTLCYGQDYILTFRKEFRGAYAERYLQSEGMTITGKVDHIGALRVKLSPEHLERLKNSNMTESIEEEQFMKLHYIPLSYPSDAYYQSGAMWNVNYIQADRAWNETTAGMNVFSRGNTGCVVAVVDTGVNVHHSELSGKCLPGWNVISNSANQSDTYGHGTFVAGLIASITDNEEGIAGAAGNCMVLPVKIASDSNISIFNASAGIVWAADNGANVINMSFGGNINSTTLKNACDYAYYEKKCVLVASAGNSSSPALDYPAGYKYIISVGSTNMEEQKSDYSNYGPDLNLTAPGGNLNSVENITSLSYSDNNGYRTGSGTSFSAPLVAGIAAVLISNGDSYYEVVSRIASTCDRTGIEPYSGGLWSRNDNMGYGRVNFYRCMETLVPPDNFLAVDAGHKAFLTWNPPLLFDGTVGGYNIYRLQGNTGVYQKITVVSSTTGSFYDLNAENGITNFYIIRALNDVNLETKPAGVSIFIDGPTATYTDTPVPVFTPTPTNTKIPAYKPELYIAAKGIINISGGETVDIKGFNGAPEPARVIIYNIAGNAVFERDKTTGDRSFQWNGRTNSGKKAAPGIYIISIEYCGQSIILKCACR